MTTRIQPFQGSYLTPCFEHATVADAMRTGVMSCPPDVPATTVARMMATHHIHSVVVETVDQDPVRGERLTWGVVSDMDLLRGARAGIDEMTAGDIAVTEPVTVEPSLPLDEAVRLMAEHDTAHLIVADRSRPIGILSTLDIAGLLAWGRS
ncbi:MAG TPA: CBS domain-containing protein [Solirubrobacteraceae bacterium]|nr:CBS domain-containing protein [Solirubrobacteraceae bacterium]